MIDLAAVHLEIAQIEVDIHEMEVGLDAARALLTERLALLAALQECGIPPTASIH